MFVGLDGCKSGWFAVQIAGHQAWSIDVLPNVESAWEAYGRASLILIDVPIGLRESGLGERQCDLEARQLLGPRASSVFPAPCRQAVYASSYEVAADTHAVIMGQKLLRQSWAIATRIRDVDYLMRRHIPARGRIREMHPEVCFWALAGGHPMQYSKKSKQGRAERLDLLQKFFPPAPEVVDQALSRFRRSDVRPDDVLDALVGAVTGWASNGHVASIPANPEIDPQGLPMEMVYRPF